MCHSHKIQGTNNEKKRGKENITKIQTCPISSFFEGQMFSN